MFQLGWRSLALVAGFLAATLTAHYGLSGKGYTLLEPYNNPRRAEGLYAYATLPYQPDVVVLGSSRVAGGFDGRILNEELARQLGQDVSVYKLGLAALRPLLLSEVLENLLVHRPPRKLLVIAVEYRFFVTAVPAHRGPPGRLIGGPTGKGAATAASSDEGVIAGEWQTDELASGFSKLFRGLKSAYLAEWVFREETQQRKRFRQDNFGEEWTVAERRPVEESKRRSQAGLDKVQNNWRWCAEDGPDWVGWRKSLELLKTLPCQVVFIRMPLVEGFEQRSMVGVAQEFERRVLPALEAAGFRYVDLNRSPYPRGPEDYVGLTHLGLSGCAKTSRAFVSELLAPWWRRQQ